ncbi:MAG: type II toxin-antitoxin system RelB/DinJ family antitoxin [Synergistaceae bacterium]|nr:type II toxin-antitoxin system RelB/DinJ family antitoxin [Synergistaceae bacterium]
MMSRTAVLNLRIEPEVKTEAEELFAGFGLTVTDAVNVFLRQSLMRGGFPFEIVRYRPNAATQAAIAEAERLLHDPKAKSFTNMDDLRADLLSDEDGPE